MSALVLAIAVLGLAGYAATRARNPRPRMLAVIVLAIAASRVGALIAFQAPQPIATSPRELPRWACEEVLTHRLERVAGYGHYDRPTAAGGWVMHYRIPRADACRR